MRNIIIENYSKKNTPDFSILNYIDDAVIIVDANGCVIFTNKKALDLIERKKSKVIGRSISKVFNITSGSVNLFSGDPVLEALSNNKFPVSLDGYSLQVNSKVIPISGNIFPFKKKSVAIIFKDISREEKLLESYSELSSVYNNILELSNDAIFILQNEKIVFVSKGWVNMFGYNEKDIYSNNLQLKDIIAPADRGLMEYYSLLKSQNKPVPNNYQVHGLTKDGKIIDLDVTEKDIFWESKKSVLCIYKDISDKRRAESIFNLLNHAVEQSPASIVITDTSGKIKYVNSKFTKQTGYTLKEVIGTSPASIGWGETSPEKFKELWDTISNGEDWRGEFFNRTKDGENYWDIASISPIKNEEGEITHFLAVTEDITDRKKQEEQLIIAKENAEKTAKLKSEFIAQMSHEIRTPLNNIISSIALLKTDLPEKIFKNNEQTFSIISTNAKRLIRTIELILELSRLQTNNFEANFKPIDLNEELFNDLLLEFFSRAQRKNLKLLYNCKLKSPLVLGDAFTLEQIFMNLIDNAIKYTLKGKIVIKIYGKKPGKIYVDIIDTGIGISEEYLPKLFAPFTQEDMSLTRRFEGTGLGLALVKKYVELNNAEIYVESKKNKGSLFRVIFDKAKK